MVSAPTFKVALAVARMPPVVSVRVASEPLAAKRWTTPPLTAWPAPVTVMPLVVTNERLFTAMAAE